MNGNEFEYFLDNLSLPTLLAKSSFAFLLLSMLFYWFQASFQYNRETEPSFDILNSGEARILSKKGNISWMHSLFGKAPSLAMGLANIALALMLLIRWVESGHFPLSNLYESLLFLSWSLTSIHFLLEHAFLKGGLLLPALGAITAPLALFTNAFATFSLPQEMQKVSVLVPALQSNWLIMHVSVMMVSYAALLSGSLLAMAFLVVKFFSDNLSVKNVDSLRYKQDEQFSFINYWSSLTPSWFAPSTSLEEIEQDDPCFTCVQGTEKMEKHDGQNLPCKKGGFNVLHFTGGEETFEEKLKQTLDNLSYRSIGLGFALLTIGIFSGAVWANEAWGSYWSWDPKETWAFVTWLVFALYLHTRLSRGWVGKESALVATFGFLVIWFCYLGVNLFGKGLHSYGWFPAN